MVVLLLITNVVFLNEHKQNRLNITKIFFSSVPLGKRFSHDSKTCKPHVVYVVYMSVSAVDVVRQAVNKVITHIQCPQSEGYAHIDSKTK